MSDAGEIIKSGAFDKLADIVHKLAGPMADEIGLLMADKIRVYRVRNWVNVVKKTQRILAEAHISPEAVPPRLFLPILEASSIESDETLQDLWAGILASASEESDSLSPSFIETLKQLTPAEAKALNKYFDPNKFKKSIRLGEGLILPFDGPPGDAPSRLETETFERLGLIRREYDLQQGRHKPRSNFYNIESQLKQLYNFSRSLNANALPELTYEFTFTDYGIRFMKACAGDRKRMTRHQHNRTLLFLRHLARASSTSSRNGLAWCSGYPTVWNHGLTNARAMEPNGTPSPHYS